MAGWRTNGHAFSTAAGTHTNNFVLSVGDLLVACLAYTGGTPGGGVVSDNNTDGHNATTDWDYPINVTWASGANTISIGIRKFLAANTFNTTFTLADPPGSDTGGGLNVSAWTGMTKVGSAAVRQWKSAPFSAGATPAVTLDSAALTGNPILLFMQCATNASTNWGMPTGWTERNDTGYASPNTGTGFATRDSGFTGTTITWTATTPSAGVVIAVELDASASPATVDLGAVAVAGTGAITATATGFTNPTLGSLAVAGTGAVTVTGLTPLKVLGALALAGTGAVAVSGLTDTAILGALALDGTDAIAVSALATNPTLGALALGGTGAVAVSALVDQAILGALALTGTGSLSVAALTDIAILGSLVLAGAGDIAVADLSTGSSIIDFGILALAGAGDVEVASLTPQAVLGALSLAGNDALAVSALTQEAILGALSIARTGHVTVSGLTIMEILTVQLGLLALEGAGTVTAGSPQMERVFGQLSLERRPRRPKRDPVNVKRLKAGPRGSAMK